MRIPPKFYVATEGRVFFVEGFTSDDTRDWKLMTGFRSFDGYVDMKSAKPIEDLFDHDWTLTPWGKRPSDRVLNQFTWLVANFQRAASLIPPLRMGGWGQ